METGKDGAVGRQLRTLFNVGAIRELTDGQLLERFATGRGEGAELAFAALVERHGSMVLRVARGVLDDPHESQDAFQATFLVLVAKARGLWVRDSLGPWLHQVAYRTASSARTNAARRRRLERRAAVDIEARPEAKPDDLARVLLEEVDRLPERYRAPVVLCDLEGRTHEQAARALGWPIGTVKSRQARARERLRARLTRRGVAPGLGLLASRSPLPIPASLLDQTTVAAVRFVASRAIVPGSAAVLAREVIRAMTILRWTKAASALLAAGVAASGAGLIAQDRGEKPADAPKVAGSPKDAAAADPPVFEVKPGKLDFTLIERGVVEPSRNLDLISEVEGNTVILVVKPDGAMVKAGEVVVELDSSTLRDRLVNQNITVHQAEAAYKQAGLVREVAESAIKEYRQGILLQDRATLRGEINLAKSGIDEGRARLERTRLARKRLDEAIARRVGPETPSDVVADLTLNDRLEANKLDIQKEEFGLERAMTQLEVLEKYTAEKNTKQLTSQAERARAEELSKQSTWALEKVRGKQLERQIERCTLKAPADGVVSYPSNPGRGASPIEEGATVRERQKILTLFELVDPMRINAQVHEPLVHVLKPGQAVRIQVNAGRQVALTGVVQSVAPRPDEATFLRSGQKIYPTLIRIDENAKNAANLRPGMSARVEIVFDELDNALWVPIACVVDFAEDKGHVDVKTPGGAIERREVTFGKSDLKVVEVKAGLKPGELVVLKPEPEKSLEIKDKAPPDRKAPATGAKPF